MVSNSKKKIFTLDGILFLSRTKNIITNNEDFYINFINSDNRLQKYHKHVCDEMYKTISNIQRGGSTALVVGVSTLGLSLSTVLAYFIYRWVSWETCDPVYPISEEGTVITPAELILKIVPSSWKKDKSPEEMIDSIKDKTINLINTFSLLDTESSTTKKVTVNLLRVTASIGLDVVTAGAGGDIIISLLFTFKTALDLLSALIEGFIEFLDDNDAIRFMKDLINVNFKKGPFGVKCWVDYILQKYGNKTKIYDIICTFFSKIFNKIITFISNAIGSVIPNSVGLPAILIPLLVNHFKDRAMDILEYKINEYYEQIPHDWKTFIKNPKLMNEYLKSIIDDVPSFIMTGELKTFFLALKDNTVAFAYFMHKFFAITYVTLYILTACFESEKTRGNINDIVIDKKK